jgi:xanthine dehydrogenase accessory factor
MLTAAARLIDERRPFALATLIFVRGSAPRHAGTRMLVLPGGFLGTIGGGPLEALVLREGRAALRDGKTRRTLYSLAPGGENPTGLYCGGQVEVLVEPIMPKPRLMIFGGGHIGQALASLGLALDFLVEGIEDRPEFLRQFPAGAARKAASGWEDEDWTPPPVDGASYCLIATRCHATDLAVLKKILPLKPAYLGVIGSRTKRKFMEKELKKAGVKFKPADFVSPAGLDIGAESPAEIALSVLAQIVAVERLSR